MDLRIAVAAAALTALTLAGCSAQPVQASSTPVLTASASAGDAGLARFAAAANQVAASQDDPGGMDFVRALEAAGWRRAQLQVTADRTSVGLDVPAVQFAASDDGSCLIGQYGKAGLTVLRAAPVDGTCLIGATRDLD